MKTTTVMSLLCLSLGLCMGRADTNAPFTLDCGYWAQENGSSVYHPCLRQITVNCDGEANSLDPGGSWLSGLPGLPGVPPPLNCPPGPGTIIPTKISKSESCCHGEPDGPTGPDFGNYEDVARCTTCGPGGAGVPIVGMPTWSVTEPALTFWLRDVPVWTKPGRGNPLRSGAANDGSQGQTRRLFVLA